jgi:hypothetical protein
MPTLPDRQALRALYDEAVLEIQARRPGSIDLTKGFYAQIGDVVFERGYLAIADGCEDANSYIHTIPAPVGSGKTSFSYALMVALARYADAHPEAPYGAVFVCDQIEKADETYRELNELLPGKVAIWTGDHNKTRPKGEKVKHPAALFTQDELKLYELIVVTHRFYADKNGYKARHVVRRRDGKFLPRRGIYIIDERPEHIDTYEITFTDAQNLKTAICTQRPDLTDHIEALWKRMAPFEVGNEANKIRRPARAYKRLAEELKWFRSAEADAVLSNEGKDLPALGQLVGIARCMMEGCVFTVPDAAVVRFVGWKTKDIAYPGTMLLDATADIDGVSLISPDRVTAEVPKANYANLEIIVVPQHTKKNLKQYLSSAANQFAYVDHMVTVIKAHMNPGERGLVICKNALFEQQRVPDWGEKDPWFNTPAAYTEGYAWNIEGRELCATHWGTGVGSNAWKKADVVFLFDWFYIPRRIAIATTQGLRGHRATQGDLGSMTTLRDKATGVDIIQTGHMLRHTKQLALRGNARCYDQYGVCGKQRLVISCDPKSFLEHKALLFPGAPDPIIVQGTHKRTVADKVLDFLSSVDPHTKVINTKQLKDTLEKPWGAVSRNVLTEKFHGAARGLGWDYRQGKGCKGSHFVRTTEALSCPEADTQPILMAFRALEGAIQ